METKHSKGKWLFKEQGDANEYCILTEDNKWVAAFQLNGEQTVEQQRSNAKLMAAAPDLLEALKELKKWVCRLEDWEGIDPPVEQALNAIKKATE